MYRTLFGDFPGFPELVGTLQIKLDRMLGLVWTKLFGTYLSVGRDVPIKGSGL